MDASTPVGVWYLAAGASRLALSILLQGDVFSGTIADERGGAPDRLERITWDAESRWLELRRNGPGFFQWYRVSLTHGVMAGRFSHSAGAARPLLTAYTEHVTGWSPSWLDADIVPRTWNLAIDGVFSAVLRIDRDAEDVLCGRLRVFGPLEELEDDLTSITWDGTNLSFTRIAGSTQVFTGTANGRFLRGTFTQDGGAPAPWTGARAEVLGFGLGSRLPQRDVWQTATRARVINLTEGMRLADAGTPPITVARQGPAGPFLGPYPPERDDDPTAWAPSYTIQKLEFTVSPGSRFDPANPPPPRVFSGYLATPTGAAPPGGFSAVVAVNGHNGSARQCLTASDESYWYGESAARRGLIVLALDIGHRPRWNVGPIVHPDIIDAGYRDSNWEEDGERSFSVRCAIGWLLGQPNVRGDSLFLWGLSLGGEITAITGGLDPRIAMPLVCDFWPDMHVMDRHGNHPCYKWVHADIHEYLDVSDWGAFTAPRPLLVETGKVDFTYSSAVPPYAADKQVMRRTRAAYGADAGRLIHYLHYDAHRPHVGAANPTHPSRPQGILTVAVTEPIRPGDPSWQTDGSTNVRSPSLYDLMNELVTRP